MKERNKRKREMCIILGGNSSEAPSDTKILHLTHGAYQYLTYSNIMKPVGERNLFLIIALRKGQEELHFGTTDDPKAFSFIEKFMPQPVARGIRGVQVMETEHAEAIATPHWNESYEHFMQVLGDKAPGVTLSRSLYEQIVNYYKGAATERPGTEFRALLVKPKQGAKLCGIFVRFAAVPFVHIPMLDVHAPVQGLAPLAEYDHRILICSSSAQPPPILSVPAEPEDKYVRAKNPVAQPFVMRGPLPEEAAEGLIKFLADSIERVSFDQKMAWQWPHMETVRYAAYRIKGPAINGDLFSFSPAPISIPHSREASPTRSRSEKNRDKARESLVSKLHFLRDQRARRSGHVPKA